MTQRNTTKTPVFTATKKDFIVDWFSGQGAGGQHRNKHQNCCRITHRDSGLVAVGQDHRSRVSNQRDAFNRLAKQLVEHYSLNTAPERVISEETIRTYHAPRNIVKDHASGHTQEYKTVVLDGDISEMVDARKTAMASEDGGDKSE